MRLLTFTACTLMSVSACAGRHRAPATVVQGTAIVQPRAAQVDPAAGSGHPPWAVGGGVTLPPGTYDLALWFDVPRPQLVDWTLTCPGVERTGTVGEPAVQATASGDPTLVGFGAPGATPTIGPSRLTDRVRVTTTSRGVCALIVTADDPSVLGTYQVLPAGASPVATPAPLPRRVLVAPPVAHEIPYVAPPTDEELAPPIAQPQARPDLEQRRLDIALHARDRLRQRFLAWGAVARPPMPALLDEEPGDPPYPGAIWTAGKWVWSNGRWEWRAGYWSDPDVFTGVMIGYGSDFEIGGGELETETLRDHRNGKNDRVRDHRDGQSWGSDNVRDHRDDKKPEPTVRDHRNSRDEIPASPLRDHRDDKKQDDDDDDDRQIRDHRRR